MADLNGGHLVARTLKQAGVNHLFTLCGGHVSPVLVGAKAMGIRVVDVRHEATAVFAADAVAPRHAALQPPLLVVERHGEPVDLQLGDVGQLALADHPEDPLLELPELGLAVGVVEAEHRHAVAEARELLRRLPAHPEVPEALERLHKAGLRLAALTNSTEEVARAQLEHAGIVGWFEQVLSADMVERLKPAPEPYLLAGQRLGVAVGRVRLVAAHAWDVAGAARAGCATAFVARPGKVLDPLVEAPDVIGADLAEVADRIIATDVGDR